MLYGPIHASFGGEDQALHVTLTIDGNVRRRIALNQKALLRSVEMQFHVDLACVGLIDSGKGAA